MRTLIWALRPRGALTLWRCVPKPQYGLVKPRAELVSNFSFLRRCHAEANRDVFSWPQDLPETKSEENLEKTILDRARSYGINTIDQLLYQSSVGHTDHHLGRIVDREIGRLDFDLWCIYLDFQRLRFGDEGVKAIYRGLQTRCGRHFPLVGPQADHLWDAFIATGTRDLAFLRTSCNFEVRSGAQRETFMADVLGRLLEGENPSWARATTWRLRGNHQINRAQILDTFLCACRSDRKEALENFCVVYAALSRSNLYRDVIDHLFRANRIDEAFFMHRRLISVGDLPQDFEAIAPLVRSFAQNGSGLIHFLRELEHAGASFESQARKFYELERTRVVGFSSTNLNIVASTTFRQPRRIVTDDFAARAFATASLPFDLVLGGLRLLGLIAVGPLSVREIALSAGGPEGLAKRFAKLREVEVDTGASTYVRVLKKLAFRGQTTLLDAVLETDQHPDVFDDTDLQKQLLIRYYNSREWPQINRTLAILNVGETDRRADERSANFMLQTALVVKDWLAIRQLIAKMRRDRQQIYINTVQVMRGLLSPKSAKSIQRSKGEPDEIGFLTRLWQDVLKSGVHFEPGYWGEVICRLGTLGRWEELERTVLWIASWYSSAERHSKENGDTIVPQPALQQLFNPRMQGTIVAWAFLSRTYLSHEHTGPGSSAPHRVTPEHPWIRGIRLLRSLQGYGIRIHHGTVQGVLIHRLRILFSEGGFSKRLRNRRLRTWNSTSLDRYLITFYQAWMKPLGAAEEQHLVRHILKSRRPRPRDVPYLHLAKTREMHQQRQAALAQRWRQRRARGRIAETPNNHKPAIDPIQGVVMHRDLFTAS